MQTRKHALGLTLLINFLACFLAAAAWCGQAAAGKNNDNRLVFGHLSPCRTLDPAQALDVDSIQVGREIFEGLVRLKDGSLEIEPWLAESWTADPGFTVWTFTLRPRVLFHDGTLCDAEAVAFSLRRQLDPGHPFHAGFSDAPPLPLRKVAAVEALDSRTVRITLSEPQAGFLLGLSLLQASAVSPAAVTSCGQDFARRPVGTGPFRLERWDPDGSVTLEANDAYWGPKPRLGQIVFWPVPDDAMRFQEFQLGCLDVMSGVPPTDAPRVERMPGARLHSLPGLSVSYLAMNTRQPPFDRRAVRQAVSHAINTPDLVRLIYQGSAEVARGVLPPGVQGYDPTRRGPAYDPDLARRLLAEAGLAGGFETTLWTTNVSRPYLPHPVKIAETIKGDLEAVDIRVHVVSLNFNDFLEKAPRGEHGMCLFGWVMDTPDPDYFLTSTLGGEPQPGDINLNLSNWRDGRVLGLLDRARVEIDPARRAALYGQAQDIVRDEAPWAPLAFPRLLLAQSARVRGLVMQPTGDVRFAAAWKE